MVSSTKTSSMKLDGESSYCHSFTTTELELELGSHEQNQLNMLKIENDATWKGNDDLIAFRRSTKAEVSSVCNPDNDASNKENMMDAQCTDDQHDSPTGTTKLIQNNKESRAERTVTRIKLPEVIVCFDDGAHRIVKDVCTDDSLQSLQEIHLESNGASEHMKAAMKSYIPDLTRRKKDTIAPILEDLNSGSYIIGGKDKSFSSDPTVFQYLNSSSFNEDRKDKNYFLDMSEYGEGTITRNQISTDIFDQKISLEQLLSLEEPQSGPQHVNSSISNLDAANKERNDEKTSEEAKIHEDSTKGTASPSDTIESNQSNQLKDSSKNDKLESTFLEGSLTTSDVLSDFKTFKRSSDTREVCSPVEGEIIKPVVEFGAIASDRKENKEETDSQHFVQANSETEESISDGVTASTRSSFYQSSHADKNLLGPSYLSDPKASSGHIAYSGSISLRSDSSTTSTRSFAFPILQAEWNTSPVKMAKAERRYLRKHRCLRTVLFCCKF